ncbi:MAG TPA: hypothetical protein VEF04_09035, partial [Blastocatellia bacterium]|nr:hypothetical protein [Blastocatellia bacterium]
NLETASELEWAEAKAWIDMYHAAPEDYAQTYKLQIKHFNQLVILMSGVIPFPHFNCVMGLGLAQPATKELVDRVLTTFRDAQINNIYVRLIPHSQPDELPQWLQERNLRAKSGWDRIHRDDQPFLESAPRIIAGYGVEKITQATAEEWAEFIIGVYGVPVKPWLMALVERDCWHHYVLRRGAKILAARSMYLNQDGTAWLGIDAPVPGVMVPSYDLDFQICKAIVKDGLELGAKQFIADIEAPSVGMNSPAYENFGTLGFSKLYLRNNYGY